MTPSSSILSVELANMPMLDGFPPSLRLRWTLAACLALSFSAGSALAADIVDAHRYLRQQGWEDYEGKNVARSPDADIAPLMYYDKGNTVPSCGILAASAAGKPPVFIELVGSEPGVGFPQCLGIPSITPFRLQNKDYIAVEYLARETREDIDRHYLYLVRDRARGIVQDDALNKAVPSTATNTAGTGAHALQGVKLARAAQLAKTYPAWHLLERDFISGLSSSFAILENRKTGQCQFVAEAGAAPVAVAHTAFAFQANCAEVLASSRFETKGKVFYLAMFRDQAGKQWVGVLSVAPDGSVVAETDLAARINGAGATKDMKSAKAFLEKEAAR